MILTLHTETTIDSSHKLVGYEGNCANLHGHTWKIELWFRGSSHCRDKTGILVDFNIVKDIKKKLDHCYLNNVLGYNPTAENLTEYIYNYVKSTIQKNIEVKVRIYENCVDKKTFCEGGDF